MRTHPYPFALCLVLLGLGAARAAATEPDASLANSSQTPPSGLAVGVELGEPSAATVRYSLAEGKFGIQAGIGSGVFGGYGLHVHGDLTFGVLKLGKRSQVYLGLGARYYQHTYEPASIDEIPDTHFGLRLPIGLTAPVGGRLELYLQAAPGYDLKRSESCSLISGANSLCPHAVSSRWFVQAVVGARFYF